MAINTLIFDFDGTLVDSEMAHLHATHIFLNRLGITMPEGDFIGKGLLDFLHTLKEARPSISLSIPQLVQLYEEAFLQVAGDHVRPYAKVIDLAKEAKAQGYQVAIASGSHLSLLNKLIPLFGMQDLFNEHVYSSEHDALGKPAPDLFLRVAGILGSAPNNVLVLEDSYPGYLAAMRAGMHVVMLPDPRYSSHHSFDDAHLLFDTPNNIDHQSVFRYCQAPTLAGSLTQ